MSVLIDIDTAELYGQFFRPKYPKMFTNEPLLQCAVSFKCRFL